MKCPCLRKVPTEGEARNGPDPVFGATPAPESAGPTISHGSGQRRTLRPPPGLTRTWIGWLASNRAMRRSGILVVAVTVAALVSGCGSADTTLTSVPPTYGAVRGTVTAGPTCPVEQAGHPCPTRPVSGAVSARRTDGTTLTGTISKDGTYRVAVPVGTYTVNVQTGSPLPRCSPVQVAVSAGATIQANIFCDTGIR